MALRKSSVLLPDVFQTDKNRKFLNATVDQLNSEPNLLRVNSFIGRRSTPNYTVGDSYVTEIDVDRQNYQLEPAVVYRQPNKTIDSLNGYLDFINTLRYNNVNVENHSDLFEQEYYNYSGFIDFDKLVNYGEYFWLPAGPDSVQVFNSTVDTQKDFAVTRRTVAGVDEYSIDNSDNANPTIVLARGGSYTFEVSQTGTAFWIQSQQGTSGTATHQGNVSTREVFGVTNNGTDNGTITFNVPAVDAQDIYTSATVAADVDLATELTYSDIHNVTLTAFLAEYPTGIDGLTEFEGKSLIFYNFSEDSTKWGDIYSVDDRYRIYNIEINSGTIQLVASSTTWSNSTKIRIKQGVTYGNREIYKAVTGYPELITPITANLDRLYYQDATNAAQYGIIEIVDEGSVPAINITRDVLGKDKYTSTNGVSFTNGLKVEFNDDVTPSTYAGKQFYVEGVGQPGGIELVSVTDLVTPESYTATTSEGYDARAYDDGGFDGTLNAPTTQDFIVINRASPDLNAWSRINRWFHREVIEATANYNNYTADIDDSARAKRPIIEFTAGLNLYNMGTSSVSPVTVVDTTQTDAFSNVNGTAGYFADGIDLQNGNTVIFSNDNDADVKTTIYRVDMVDQDEDATTDEIINLTAIGTVTDGNCVLSSLGTNNQGKQYWLDGTTWKTAQLKTKINQEPLFDLFDPDHVSFSDQTKYPSSNFVGSKLFSYKRNNAAAPDTVLNFGLTYKNFSTIGDIVFENNFDQDTFQYTRQSGNVNVILRSGHTHIFDRNGQRSLVNGWTKTVENSIQHQIKTVTVKSDELYSFEIGAPVDTSKIREPLQVFVNGNFVPNTQYTHLVQNSREYVVFTDKRTVDDIITIKFFSATKAAGSFYEVPDNLQNNAANEKFDTLTLGQLRNHTVEISRQIKTFSGKAPGKSNIRDLNYKAYPGNIMQHSAGMIAPMYLLNGDVNVINSINYVRNQYNTFKNRFVDNIDKLDLDLTDPKASVDKILIHMIGKKTSVFPFYYSDMAPWGTQKTTLAYTIDDVTETEFELNTQFDLGSLSSKSVLVYHNTTLLCEGRDYTFDTDEPKIILTSAITLAVNDTVTVEEYENTDGSFIPPTPTKLGLWPKSHPRKYTDNTYTTSKTVIEGHDGSIYVGFGDIRDDIILELEKRIYSNIKTQYNSALFDYADVKPGYFRSTTAESNEFNNIVRQYFGEWSLRNKVRLQNTTHSSTDGFTWNYNNSALKLDGSRVPGYWRGIYQWLYDTDTPHTTPWKMLGVNSKPSWWDDRYGAAPYTSGNTVLWEDLRDGKLYSDATGTAFTTLANYKRADLMSIVPVDEQGNLRAPNTFLVEDAFETNSTDDWSFADVGPQESAWRRSSEWPYVMQIASALLKSAKYCTLMFDTNLYVKDTAYDQVLQNGKSYRPGIVDFKVNGSTASGSVARVEGYNQFLSEFTRFNSFSINELENKINNLEINLCYALAGYSDKKSLKVQAESISPSSSSENIFIPDEDFAIFLKKSAPLERVVYSGVQIITRANGYELQGYDVENPFFRIIPSVDNDNRLAHTVGETTYFEFSDYDNRVLDIPYGTVIRSRQQVFDFLVSYQRYLQTRGFVFDGTTGAGDKVDFVTSGKEFAFWTDQNWPIDSVIVISPYYDTLKVNRGYTTVDDLTGKIKDANNATIKNKFYNVAREDNLTTIAIDTDETNLYSVQVDPVQYEHVLVFNNTTIFNDIIYQPELGNRQARLKLIGFRTGDWNGTIHAPGFFLSEDNISIWKQYTTYKQGDFVSHQNKTYVAKEGHTSGKTFDYTNWNTADNIKTGMLQNLANKAGSPKQFYEIDDLNLEQSIDLLGKGTIGFTPKSYLAGLGLDDISQVKFYQGLLKNKGTRSAINKLIDAQLTNLDQDIDFFEEWAFRVGEYGSIDSNQLIEFVVDESTAANNPIVTTLHNNGDATSGEGLHIAEKDLYRTPNNYNSSVFPIRGTTAVTTKDLDTAGFARLDDVDWTVFSKNDLPTLGNRIDEIAKGQKIWVGSDNFDWDMLRVDETNISVTSITSTTNGFLIYTTDRAHNLTKDDYVVISVQYPVGGVLKVARVETANSFAVAVDNINVNVEGLSVPFLKLTSVRFNQPSDISSYKPANDWDIDEVVYVDNDSNGKWQVLRNTAPWTSTGPKTATGLTANNNFGRSVSLNSSGTLGIVGAPDKGNGAIIPYVRIEGALAEGNTVAYSSLGDSVDDFGYSVANFDGYAAIGAPATDGNKGSVHPFSIDQTGQFTEMPSIHPSGLGAGHKFGFSSVMSGNNRHLFVGAPGDNRVYAYTLVKIAESKKVSFTVVGDGGKNYTLDFTPISAESISVQDELGRIYLPNKDWTLSGADITFTANVSASFEVVVRQLDYFAEVENFTAGSGEFGTSIDCDYEGGRLVVGAPAATISGKTNSGEAYVYHQHIEKFVGDASTQAFTTEFDLQTQIYVEVDGVLQTETDNSEIPQDNDGSTTGFYTRSSNTVTFKYKPGNGSIITIYTGSFSQLQQIDQLDIAGETTLGSEEFGKAVAIDSKGTMIAIGAPGEDETNTDTGSVFVMQDSGRIFGTVSSGGTSYSQTATHTVYVNGRKVTVSTTSSDPADLASDINLANIPGVTASVAGGTLTVTSTDTLAYRKLSLEAGTGNTFANTTLAPFKFTQKVNHPHGLENENFGTAIAFDKYVDANNPSVETRNMIVGSEKASTMLGVLFDKETDEASADYNTATTTFDADGTRFVDRKTQSGSVYAYELLGAYNETISNPAKMVYSQQFKSTNLNELDRFGSAVAYNHNRVLIGARTDTGTKTNSGSVYEFNNNALASGWPALRSEADRIDVTQINRIALYNKKTGEIVRFLDHIDSSKRKIAGAAQSELDFISAIDPARYEDDGWTYRYLHRLWWDTSTVHFLNAEQGTTDFRVNNWNSQFPGSSIDVYEWIESETLPADYTGPGTVKSVNEYTVGNRYIESSNTTQTRYYFWVKGRTDVNPEAEFRNISAATVTALIDNPKAQGIPYAAFLAQDRVALFNVEPYLADKDVVLSINYDVVKNEGVLHSEYELFGRNNVDQNIPTRIYNKLLDSLSGANTEGHSVPDPFLSAAEKYGVLDRPRQSLFINRSAALKVLVQYCNKTFATAPFARSSDLLKLFGSETQPTINSGEWDKKVNSVAERDFLNTAILSTGYKVLVVEDENNNNYWSIYTLQSDKTWDLSRIQSYNTQDYWKYATYYATGYDATTVPTYQVTLEADLLTLTDAVTGDLAKVTSNDDGNFSIFCKKDSGWDEVIIENGTIQLEDSLYDFTTSNVNFEPTGFDNGGFDFAAYDKIPTTEIRQIVKALKEDIFVDTFKINMNELFFRLVEYAVNETSQTQDWVFKTSFVNVAHKLRELEQYPTFKFDNTEFIEDFIEEVKPYKTKIREYVSKYDKVDLFQGDTTDFDVHAFYDEELGFFRKPSGDYAGDEITRTQGLNVPWSQNYGYTIESIVVNAGGSGYIIDPTVTISAPDLANGVQATAVAKTNGDAIIAVNMVNKGSGYTSEPTITITGAGTGVKVSPRIENNKVRSFDSTLKFDRITYSSAIKDWAKNTSYSVDDIVAYKDTNTNVQEVYTVTTAFTSGTTFSTENSSGTTVMTVKADETFTNTADRIAAYYVPASGMIGDDLELLQLGTGYTANRVTGAGFDQEPGFDQANFDTGGYDNFEIDSDGLTVLAGLDTNISSTFTDLALGTRPEDIIIDGSEFVDAYNSHAPEELIPGRVYDTLDMEVYTIASNDNERDGNGATIKYSSYYDTGTQRDFEYGDPTAAADEYTSFVVYVNTTRQYSFTTDFIQKTISIGRALASGETLHIYAYSTTGENISAEQTFIADGSTTAFLLGNTFSTTKQTLVYVDGVETAVTSSEVDERTQIAFSTAPANGAFIHAFTFNQATTRDAATKFKLQTTTMTAGTYTYALENTVNYAGPFTANVIVEVDNVRLRPSSQKYSTANGSNTVFPTPSRAGEVGIVNTSDISVSVIGTDGITTNMVQGVDYTATAGDSNVTLTNAPANTATVIVSNTKDAEYFVSADGTEVTINNSVSFTSSSVLRVNTFANHDPLRIETQVHKGVGAGTPIGYDLDRTTTKMNHFWITKDGVRLHPGDYTIEEGVIILSAAQRATVTNDTILVVTHFTENTIAPTIGYRMFVDMNGNYEYRRLCKDATTTITQNVTPTSDKIYVEDVSKLPYIDSTSANPGVVFIGSERITYWSVSLEDNYISGLRRGTKGTNIIQLITPDFLVVDGGMDQELPASDTHTKTWYTLGTGAAADGKGLQSSTSTNANFLKACEAEVPNYKQELNEKNYVDADYVAEGYIEERP